MSKHREQHERRDRALEDTVLRDPGPTTADQLPFLFSADRTARADLLAQRYELVASHRAGNVEATDAFDPRVLRTVRMMRSIGPVDAAGAARFLRGALIAANLDHPNVTCVLELGVDDEGRAFYVTPKRHDVPLDVWRRGRAGTPPALGRRVTVFKELCAVIAYAHARGVIHGRLDVSCVAIGETGEVRVDGWEGASAPPAIIGTESAVPTGAPAPVGGDDVVALGAILARLLDGDGAGAPELASLAEAATRASELTPTDLAARVARFLDGERDQALRSRMAAGHAASAASALATDGDRVVATSEARTALALDPASPEATALVGRLMIEVPERLPPDAIAAIERSDQQVIQRMGTAVIAAFTAFLAYVPLMFLQGVRSLPTVVAIATMSTAMLAWAVRWRAYGPHRFSWPPMLGTAILMLLYARTFGPFVNAPAQVALAAMAVMFFPSGPRWGAVAVVFATPVVGTWLLEVAGVFETTTLVEHGRLSVSSPVVAIEAVPHYVGLVFVSVVLISVSGGLSGQLTTSQREMTRRIAIHNWRVRQIAVGPMAQRGR